MISHASWARKDIAERNLSHYGVVTDTTCGLLSKKNKSQRSNICCKYPHKQPLRFRFVSFLRRMLQYLSYLGSYEILFTGTWQGRPSCLWCLLSKLAGTYSPLRDHNSTKHLLFVHLHAFVYWSQSLWHYCLGPSNYASAIWYPPSELWRCCNNTHVTRKVWSCESAIGYGRGKGGSCSLS